VVLALLSVQLLHTALHRAFMQSVSQAGGHCLRACLEQQSRTSPSASCCCAPLPKSILSLTLLLAESHSADTVLLACEFSQLGQVTCYRQGGSKQSHLLQHTYRPDYMDRHLSRSHACAGSARGSGLLRRARKGGAALLEGQAPPLSRGHLPQSASMRLPLLLF